MKVLLDLPHETYQALAESAKAKDKNVEQVLLELANTEAAKPRATRFPPGTIERIEAFVKTLKPVEEDSTVLIREDRESH